MTPKELRDAVRAEIIAQNKRYGLYGPKSIEEADDMDEETDEEADEC